VLGRVGRPARTHDGCRNCDAFDGCRQRIAEHGGDGPAGFHYDPTHYLDDSTHFHDDSGTVQHHCRE